MGAGGSGLETACTLLVAGGAGTGLLFGGRDGWIGMTGNVGVLGFCTGGITGEDGGEAL
jgi:hypothetical protein